MFESVSMPKPNRSLTRCLLPAALACFGSGVAHAQEGVFGGTIQQSGLELEIRRVAQIPAVINNRHQDMMHNGGTELYVVQEDSGIIWEVNPDTGSATRYLDVSANLPRPFGGNVSGWFTEGLRSVSFHPDFHDSSKAGYGKLYTVLYELNPARAPIPGSTYIGPVPSQHGGSEVYEAVLAEWDHNHATGIEDSYREVFRVAITGRAHPVTSAAFNPYAQPGDDDYGMLYVPSGDAAAPAAGQALNDVPGSIVRINPLEDTVNGTSYSTPSTNPFVGNTDGTLEEIWAYGFRSLAKMSWAKDKDGTIHHIMADIGNQRAEEINIILPGKNYGWDTFEGTLANNGATTTDGFTFPVAQFGHAGGLTAVTGGFVLGEQYGDLEGQYIFANFAQSSGNPAAKARVFTADFEDMLDAVTEGFLNELTQAEVQQIQLLWDHDDDPSTDPLKFWDHDGNPGTEDILFTFRDLVNNGGRSDVRFGMGADGTMYLLNKHDGWVYEAVAVPEPASLFLMGLGGLTMRYRRR